jgi:hypothetical protein
MKNLIGILLLACSYSSFAQLEDFVKDYADTSYNERNLIETIIFKIFPSDKGDTAFFEYHDNNNISVILYQDHEGSAQYEYNENGDLTGVRVDHYRSLKRYNFYDYDYNDDDKIETLYIYDSTGTLSAANVYEYNKTGKISLQLNYKADGSLTDYVTYEYDDNGDLVIIEQFLASDQIRSRSVDASKSPVGKTFSFSYTYDENDQLEKINYTFYKANGDFDDFSYVLFTHKDGELETFKVSHGEYEKVKKKHLENKWIKEYYYVLDRNKK